MRSVTTFFSLAAHASMALGRDRNRDGETGWWFNVPRPQQLFGAFLITDHIHFTNKPLITFSQKLKTGKWESEFVNSGRSRQRETDRGKMQWTEMKKELIKTNVQWLYCQLWMHMGRKRYNTAAFGFDGLFNPNIFWWDHNRHLQNNASALLLLLLLFWKLHPWR